VRLAQSISTEYYILLFRLNLIITIIVILLVHSTVSLRSSLFRFLSGKRESREGSGTEVTKKLVAPWLSLSPAKRKRKRLLRRLLYSL